MLSKEKKSGLLSSYCWMESDGEWNSICLELKELETQLKMMKQYYQSMG